MKTPVTDSPETMTEEHNAYQRGTDQRALTLGITSQSFNEDGPNNTARQGIWERLNASKWRKPIGYGSEND